jgi:hypothetical protein
MIDVNPAPDLYDIKPLLQLGIAKYRLSFTTAVPIHTHTLAALLRSRLGYILKGRFCLFQKYQDVVCDICDLSPNCFYPILFAPTRRQIDPDNIGRGRQQATPPRPFALDVPVMTRDKVLTPDETGHIELTLFGSRAVQFQRPMLESLIHAVSSIHNSRLEMVPGDSCPNDYPLTPLFWQTLVPEFKNNQWILALKDETFIVENPVETSLENWITAIPFPRFDRDSEGTAMLPLNLRTPFQLERAREKLTFTGFLQSVFSRLRDLKRNYHTDNDMGHFSKRFHTRADQVRTFCDIQKTSHAWYSYRQQKQMNLGGLEGSLIFKGDIEPFIPLIAAGFLTGIGRKVAYGLGRFSMERYDLWQM